MSVTKIGTYSSGTVQDSHLIPSSENSTNFIYFSALGTFILLSIAIITCLLNKVKIFLSQHIGKPAVPLVKEGDRVIEGQRIAEVGRDEFGANIHASINGVVSKIEKLYIEIDGMV